MPSNEGHIHWTGIADEVIEYLGQNLEIMTGISPDDPIGALHIHAEGYVGEPLYLPNSTQNTSWDAVPGTSPTLEVRMEGYYPVGYIRIRLA